MNQHVMDTLGGKPLKLEERNLVDRHGDKRVGNYMATSSGYKYWPFDPKPKEVSVDVIAHQLAGQNRWQGAVRHKTFRSRIFYSVAEHAVYVTWYCIHILKRPDLALEALLHDASEAYIGDLIRPLKYSPEFRAPFLAVEEINEKAIAEKFNLAYPFPKEIKIADEAVTNAEHEQLIFWHPDEESESGILHERHAVAPYEITMLEPFPAKEFFMMTYHDVFGERSKFRELPTDFRV